jgi:hypothetical protein
MEERRLDREELQRRTVIPITSTEDEPIRVELVV